MKLVITACLALVLILNQPVNAGYKDGRCLDPQTNTNHNPGETWTAKDACVKHECLDNGDITGIACAVFKLKAGCYTTKEDLSKQYPDCCPQPVCP